MNCPTCSRPMTFNADIPNATNSGWHCTPCNEAAEVVAELNIKRSKGEWDWLDETEWRTFVLGQAWNRRREFK